MRGRLRLALRLAARDLRHRPGTGLLVLLAMLAATTTMTVALMVRGSAQRPWDYTFALTAGPHVVVTTYHGSEVTERAMAELGSASGVVARSGPYPLIAMPEKALQVNGVSADVQVMAHDASPVVDRPALTEGAWIRDGGVVVEKSFAVALGLAVGDRLTIAGQPFTVAGTAVTTARQPTPFADPGTVWATAADTAKLVPLAQLRGSVLMLRLADPERAPDFVAAHSDVDDLIVEDWQSTRDDALTDVLFALFGLILGAVALAMLAAASVAVAVAGRLAAQGRRAALLKAVGATPGFVALIMLSEYLIFALAAGAAGLAAGAALVPVLARPAPGVLGSVPVPRPSAVTIALVLGSAVVLIGLSTLVPTLRAARAATVRSLVNPARPPRRSRLAVAVSARLPVPLLLGLRLAARRPGRAALSAAGLSVTVAAGVTALWMEAGIGGDSGDTAFIYHKLRLVTYTFIVALVMLALVNAVLIAWTTALDNARNSALARALGATPRQVTIGLVFGSLLPAIAAVVAGIPLGFAAYSAAAAAAGGAENDPAPAVAGLLALPPVTLLVVALLIVIPSHLAGRRPVVEALESP